MRANIVKSSMRAKTQRDGEVERRNAYDAASEEICLQSVPQALEQNLGHLVSTRNIGLARYVPDNKNTATVQGSH